MELVTSRQKTQRARPERPHRLSHRTADTRAASASKTPICLSIVHCLLGLSGLSLCKKATVQPFSSPRRPRRVRRALVRLAFIHLLIQVAVQGATEVRIWQGIQVDL